MIDKPFDDIEFGDLERLVENAVAESRSMEYKRELPGGLDDAKKEFLKDVSAFANTVGGDLLYGIAEKGGIPAAIDGVEIADPDAAILKYESIIMTGIAPRISVQMKPIETPQKKTVLLVRVEKSWFAPHRVVYKGHDKFYARNSGGKYSLDTQQLREAFNLSQTVVERMKEFRIGRIFEVSAGNVPADCPGPKAILHFIPVGAFNSGFSIDVKSMKIHNVHSFSNVKVNFDGIGGRGRWLNHDEDYNVQAFRNGIVEFVLPLFITWKSKQISIHILVRDLLHAFSCSLAFAKDNSINPPAFVCLTLVGVKDRSILVGSDHYNRYVSKADRDVLQVPEEPIESYDIKPIDVLLPMCDIVCNAFGIAGLPDDEKRVLSAAPAGPFPH